MSRRRDGAGRATAPGAEPYQDPLRSSRPAWVRWVVLVMVFALLLSVVAGFVSAVST